MPKHVGRRAVSIAPYWKAFLAFVTPGAVIIGSAVLGGSDGGSAVTTAELVTAGVAMVVTGGGVFLKGNKDPNAEHQDESVQPPQGGVAGVRQILDGKGL